MICELFHLHNSCCVFANIQCGCFVCIVLAYRQEGFGGVAIAIHHSVQVRPIRICESLSNDLVAHSIDLVGVDVFSYFPQSIQIWSIYISPSSNLSDMIVKNMFGLMSLRSILAGDFNAHHFAWGSSKSDFIGKLLNNIASSFNVCILNTGSVTRVGRPPFSDSVIDVSFCSSGLFWSTSWNTLDQTFGGDHFPIIIKLSLTGRSQDTDFTHWKSPGSAFCFDKANWSEFSSGLNSELLSFPFSNSILDTYDNLIKVVLKAAPAYIPLKRKSHKIFKQSPIW